MKLKRITIFALFLFILIICWLLISKNNQSNIQQIKKLTNATENSYFISVPITKFTPGHTPCLQVEIAGKSLSAMLDLGFRGAFEITNELLQKIEDKSLIRSYAKYGLRGKAYQTNVYQIPKIKMGKLTFSKPHVEQSHEEMRKAAILTRDGTKPSTPEPVLLGWEIFSDTNLFMDFENSTIAFCDSFDTLVKQGYFADTFVKVPLLLERGLIEFDAITPRGPLRCVVDTGCTWNALNIPNEENRAFEDLSWDPKNQTHFPEFTIGNKDFGSVSFRGLPILLPIHIEAILGMDFLIDHLVFIDFTNKQIYFASSIPK